MISSYYNYDKIMSYNAVYNFIVGARGLGKTYGFKEKAINSAIKTGEQFIYLRRYKDEIKDAKPSFFADIAYRYPKHAFKIKGDRALMTSDIELPEKKKQWQEIGFFIPLSRSQSYKSVPFPNVTKICFDEFIIEKGVIRYLAKEAKIFNDFYSTVDRYKDKTRVFFLANSLSITNPYFLEYGILPKTEELIRVHDGFVVAHFPNSEKFINEVYQTRFGKFIEGTEYSKEAVANQFKDNHEHLLQTKTGRARYKYTVETIQGTFSVWYDNVTNVYYVTQKRPGGERKYTTIPENMREGWELIDYNNKLLQFIRTSFRKGDVSFDTALSRNAFIELFRR